MWGLSMGESTLTDWQSNIKNTVSVPENPARRVRPFVEINDGRDRFVDDVS
jgi:hypothetical protein